MDLLARHGSIRVEEMGKATRSVHPVFELKTVTPACLRCSSPAGKFREPPWGYV